MLFGSRPLEVEKDKANDIWLYHHTRPSKVTFSAEFLTACGKERHWRPLPGLLDPKTAKAVNKVGYENCGSGMGFVEAHPFLRPYVSLCPDKDGTSRINFDHNGYTLTQIRSLFAAKDNVTSLEYLDCVKAAQSRTFTRHENPVKPLKVIVIPQYCNRRDIDHQDSTEIFHLDLDEQ